MNIPYCIIKYQRHKMLNSIVMKIVKMRKLSETILPISKLKKHFGRAT